MVRSMRRTIVVLLAALLLAGCSRETQVWLPEEEVVELQGKDVVRIPMGAETEPAPTEPVPEPVEATEPEPTQPIETEKASITKKPTTTPKKNTSASTTTKKETVTATGAPISTEPPAIEPPLTEPPSYDISDYRVGNLEYELLDRINEYRTDEELEPLWIDEWLCAIASYRSFEASQVWSHTRPDGRYFATVLDDYGYAAWGVQELMVYDSGSGDGTAMVDRWMESKAQRELILGDYTTAGVGVYRADGLTYVTCLLTQ